MEGGDDFVAGHGRLVSSSPGSSPGHARMIPRHCLGVPEPGVMTLVGLGLVSHALLRIAYHVLADGTVYRELGVDYYARAF